MINGIKAAMQGQGKDKDRAGAAQGRGGGGSLMWIGSGFGVLSALRLRHAPVER